MSWLIEKGNTQLVFSFTEVEKGKDPEVIFCDSFWNLELIRINDFRGVAVMTSFERHFSNTDEIHSYTQCVILSSVICKKWEHFLENTREFIMRQWWVFKEEVQ